MSVFQHAITNFVTCVKKQGQSDSFLKIVLSFYHNRTNKSKKSLDREEFNEKEIFFNKFLTIVELQVLMYGISDVILNLLFDYLNSYRCLYTIFVGF